MFVKSVNKLARPKQYSALSSSLHRNMEGMKFVKTLDIPRDTVNQVIQFTHEFPDRENNVSVLSSKRSTIYLLATNHRDPKYQIDVANIVKYLKPDIAVIELCANRACGCQKHRGNIFQKIPKLSFGYLYKCSSEIGLVPACVYLVDSYKEQHSDENLWLEHDDEIIDSLLEVKESCNCKLVLGDRPIDITVKKRASLLRRKQKVRLISQVALALILRPLKNHFLLNASKLLRKHQEMNDVLVLERDLFLVYCLQNIIRNRDQHSTLKIVAIVSEGHMDGIRKHWGKVFTNVMPLIVSENLTQH